MRRSFILMRNFFNSKEESALKELEGAFACYFSNFLGTKFVVRYILRYGHPFQGFFFTFFATIHIIVIICDTQD